MTYLKRTFYRTLTYKDFYFCIPAYETLSDENRRKEYDQFGHDAFTNGGRGGGSEKHFHQHFNFEDLLKEFDFFGDNPHTRSKRHFENHHFRSHQDASSRHRRHLDDFAFGGGLFNDMFEDMEKMFTFGSFGDVPRHNIRTDQRFQGSSKHCRTVTQRRGNMVTTYTDCSGQ